MAGETYDEDAHPRDEQGRFTSGGGGGGAAGPKEWAKQGAKGQAAGGGKGASAKKWAAKDAKAATSAARLASIGAESRGHHGTPEGDALHLKAAEAHEAAAKANREAGNERAASAHEGVVLGKLAERGRGRPG